jgi:MYXO-CTERM domain-containing protein
MNRIRAFLLVVMAFALMSAGAFAQVTPPPAGEPAAPAVTPVEPTPTTPPAPTTTPPAPTTPTTPPAQTTTTTPPAPTTTTAPRRGFDWGWIGLLGLLGLAGLARREPRPVERVGVYPATHSDDATTPRGGAR